MSTVLVLGAGGFIGRHVVDELARRGHSVEAVSIEPPRASSAHVQWRQLDVDSAEGLAADVVIHLAEPSLLSDPAQGGRNLARAGRVLAGRFGRVVYASSAVVYGDQAETPRTEDAAVAATGDYARAKLAAEALFAADPRSAIARLSNVYGRGMSSVNVLSDILRQLDRTGPIEVRDLAPVRDYVHVTDVARAFAELATSTITGIVNIGTGRGTSVEELARIACRAHGTPERELVATAPRPGRSTLVLDVQRAHRELGWQPDISIEQGITSLVQEQTT